jgi:uncharacterized protein
LNRSKLDYRLIIGLVLSHLLLFFTFNDHKVFWYMFTASMLLLISFSISIEELEDNLPLPKYLLYGITTGLLFYGFCSLGALLMDLLKIPVKDDISRLYTYYSPTLFWHYLALMLIAVPGEEIFWRGFILKRLEKSIGIKGGILISALLYASVNVYSGEWVLIFATFIAGLYWGGIYVWRRSLPLIIVSHLIFDLFIFILYPI